METWQFCWWPFWGWLGDLQMGDKQVTAWITCKTCCFRVISHCFMDKIHKWNGTWPSLLHFCWATNNSKTDVLSTHQPPKLKHQEFTKKTQTNIKLLKKLKIKVWFRWFSLEKGWCVAPTKADWSWGESTSTLWFWELVGFLKQSSIFRIGKYHSSLATSKSLPQYHTHDGSMGLVYFPYIGFILHGSHLDRYIPVPMHPLWGLSILLDPGVKTTGSLQNTPRPL